MKYVKRILTISLFILGLAGILLASSYVFVPKNNAADSGMEESRANGVLGEKSNTLDIVILGDSESTCSFVPLQLWKDTGYTSYVCGTNAQTLDYTNVMLKRVFTKQSPKIVLLETNALYRKQSIINIMFTRLCEKFTVFRYHDRWKILGWGDFNNKSDYTWTDDLKGYVYSTIVNPSQKSKYMLITDKKEEIPTLNRNSVQEIKKFCDNNGAKLILVSAPTTLLWNYARHNAMKEFSSELGCEYIDMNLLTKKIPIDWKKDTRDKGDHLNYFGATKVTKYMSSYLKSTGLLVNHKNDPVYKDWDKALARFEKTTQSQ